MNTVGRSWRALASGLIALAVISGHPAAQAPAITVMPENPTILVGQTQAFTANGALVPAVVSSGGYHSCVLLPDRTLRCWGRNNFGQLGDGTFSHSSVLVAVRGLSGAVTRVGTGAEFSCALIENGSVQCWGSDFTGQLGDGPNSSISTVPVNVTGITNASEIALGGFHACATLADRTVRCWGRNADGQLGDGTLVDSTVPVGVAGLDNVAALTAGGYHTCAVRADGTVQCWGRNDSGQLGNATNVSSAAPVTVSGLANPADVRGGFYFTCALLQDRTVRCWGQNESGQLGIGTVSSRSTVPVQVNGIANAVAISPGGFHACALLADGTVSCWGQNDFGQLGNGSTTNSSLPVQVTGLTGVAAIAAGGLHTCARLASGAVRCWGEGDFGQLGNGAMAHSSTPVAVTGTGVTWSSSNTAVATIDATGLATGLARGSTFITATDGSGSSASTMLTVTEPAGPATLSVSALGTGSGSVSSSPAGISCGADCTETYPSGTVVTLTATASSASVFAGWSGGGCTGTGTCTVTLTADITISARFDPIGVPLTVTRTGNGGGTVSSSPAGISCGMDCDETYPSGTVVTLTATPNGGSVFAGWTGGSCSGTGTCAVTLAAATTVSARFDLLSFALTVSRTGTGGGTVSSSPAGISCGTDCAEAYPSGTVVTLTATPDSGSVFAGWSGGGCTGTGTCAATVSADTGVSARFDPITFPLTVSRLGAGAGTVSSSPAGISCGTDCSESYVSGTLVTLTAAAAPGSILTGWSGCGTASGATCTVTMTVARSVSATFVRVFTLTVQKSGLIGGGTVTSSPAGINCGSACSASYVSGTIVTLTATPGPLSVFTGWSGCDTASGRTCTVTMSAARSVTAGFLGLFAP
jgi:alpha-tubulin suppressor-like RCC1 family protein